MFLGLDSLEAGNRVEREEEEEDKGHKVEESLQEQGDSWEDRWLLLKLLCWFRTACYA